MPPPEGQPADARVTHDATRRRQAERLAVAVEVGVEAPAL